MPESLGSLGRLADLNLSYNVLETLPDEVAKLSSLETLNVRRNKLTALPLSMRQLEGTLQTLDVRENPYLTQPPAEVCLGGIGYIFPWMNEQAKLIRMAEVRMNLPPFDAHQPSLCEPAAVNATFGNILMGWAVDQCGRDHAETLIPLARCFHGVGRRKRHSRKDVQLEEQLLDWFGQAVVKDSHGSRRPPQIGIDSRRCRGPRGRGGESRPTD